MAAPLAPGAPDLLLVEDDALFSRALVRSFAPRYRSLVVDSVAAARKAVSSFDAPPLGVILDIDLPDGSGLDLMPLLRERFGAIPVLVLTGLQESRLINAAQEQDAQYAVKPVPPENLRTFLRRVSSSPAAIERARPIELARFVTEHKLREHERKLLAAMLSGVSRSQLGEHLGLGENTLKSQIRLLLAKFGGVSNLGDLVKLIEERASRAVP